MPEKKEWYRNWFDSPYYDLLYRDRDQEEADVFIHNLVSYLVPPKNASMLDLACGKGRYSIALNRSGYHVTGMDLSQRKIQAARENESYTLSFVLHDMRLPFERNRYDYIFNLFTSFGYFDNKVENKMVLTNVYNALKKGGIFVLDYVNGEKAAIYLQEFEKYTVEGIEFAIHRLVKDDVIIKEIKVKDGEKQYDFKEKIYIFSESRLEEYITECGFEIKAVFGDYKLNEFDSLHSDRLIIVCRKV